MSSAEEVIGMIERRGQVELLAIAGADFDYDLTDAVTIKNVLTYTNGDADTFGFVPSGAAVHASALASVTSLHVRVAWSRAESSMLCASSNTVTISLGSRSIQRKNCSRMFGSRRWW